MKRLLCLLVAVCLGLNTQAQSPHRSYLSKSELPDVLRILPPPPAEGSAAFQYDEAQHQWGKSLRRTPRGERAALEATTNVDTMALLFSGAFGRSLSREETPRTLELVARSIRTFRKSVQQPKNFYLRKRPFVYYNEDTLFPAHEAHERNTGSYPSGHTVRAWGLALVLSQLCPERQDTLMRAAYEWGQSRVIAGYHWQSDIEAAKTTAAAVFARLQTCPAYLEDVRKAREELTGVEYRLFYVPLSINTLER